MKTFAIVVKEYTKGKDYGVSHIRDATHLMVYLGDSKYPVLYPISGLGELEEGERGPEMRRYLEEILKKHKINSIDVLVTVTPIRVKGPWKKNDVYKERSDAGKIAEKYITEKEKLEGMARDLYT